MQTRELKPCVPPFFQAQEARHPATETSARKDKRSCCHEVQPKQKAQEGWLWDVASRHYCLLCPEHQSMSDATRASGCWDEEKHCLLIPEAAIVTISRTVRTIKLAFQAPILALYPILSLLPTLPSSSGNSQAGLACALFFYSLKYSAEFYICYWETLWLVLIFPSIAALLHGDGSSLQHWVFAMQTLRASASRFSIRLCFLQELMLAKQKRCLSLAARHGWGH